MGAVDVNVHLNNQENITVDVTASGNTYWLDIAGVTFFFRKDDKSRQAARDIAVNATKLLTILSAEDEE